MRPFNRLPFRAKTRPFAAATGSLALSLGLCAAAVALLSGATSPHSAFAALYPHDGRRLMNEADYLRFSGAGVLICQTDMGTIERGAAAWLIGARDLVVLNAHNFVDKRLRPTRPVSDCYFQIGEESGAFEPESLKLGADVATKALHITDDWALLRLAQPLSERITPQPPPDAADVATGAAPLAVTMVSPAGHSNSTLATSAESCEIRQIDPPSEGGVRRARHNCNDGYGGSGSGLFTPDGKLIALHSASLDMNQRRPFDMEAHYGSALLFEGALLEAIRKELAARP